MRSGVGLFVYFCAIAIWVSVARAVRSRPWKVLFFAGVALTALALFPPFISICLLAGGTAVGVGALKWIHEMLVRSAENRACRGKRRRFQFSLGTLLSVALFINVTLSWVAVEMGRARDNRFAVTAIRRAGGYVGYEHLYGEGVGPEPLEVGLEKLFGEFTWVRVTTSELKYATRFRRLEILEIKGATDADLEQLKVFTNLKYLVVCGPGVTDSGLQYLTRLKSLRTLNVWACPQVTIAGADRVLNTLPNCHLEGRAAIENRHEGRKRGGTQKRGIPGIVPRSL
jgi:hypothetical protein